MNKNFPLTDIQLAYVMGRNSNFTLGGVSTHTYYEVDTKLSIANFEKALNYVIDNQPMLRTIILDNGQQQILDEVPYYKIERDDVSQLQVSEKEKTFLKYREDMSHALFPLNKWPMFEFKAVKLNDSTHRLFFSVDLLIADGSSIAILMNEIIKCYNSGTPRPPLKAQFSDYVVDSQERKQSPRYAKDKEYWEHNIVFLPPAPDLPVRSLSKENSHSFKRIEFKLEKSNWKKIKECIKKMNVSPTIYLMTLYSIALGKWNTSKEFTLNFTLTDRMHIKEDADRIIGDFTSSVLVPIDYPSVNTDISDAVKYLKGALFRGLRRNSFTGVEVLKLLSKQNSSKSVMMPYVFTSLLIEDNLFDSIDEVGIIKYGISQTPQVYLDCQVMEMKKYLSVTWDYVESAFDEELINSMFSFFTSSILNIDGNHLESNGLCEKDQCILKLYNDSYEAFPQTTLTELLMTSFEENRNKIAVKLGNEILTYSDLYDRAMDLAGSLAGINVAPGDFIGVLAYRSIETIVQIIAIVLSGAAYVPIDPDHPKERQDYIMKHSKCKILINDFSPSVPTDFNLEKPKSTDIAYVIYTSGSTGEPKGVVITHGAVSNTILDINNRFNITDQDVIIGISSFCFDLSVYDIFGAMSTGATLVLISDPRNIPEIYSVLAEDKITFWNTVPAIMDLLVDAIARKRNIILPYWKSGANHNVTIYDTSSLRNILLSGDWIPLLLPEKIKHAFPTANVFSLGGATEASIWSICFPIDKVDPAWVSIPYGFPLANQQLYILNSKLEQCPIGVTGEICIGGVGVAQGYQNSPDKTEQSFVQHKKYGYIYRTGDFGCMSYLGYIVFQGRKDGQIKIRGHRIELGEIEKIIAKYPQVNSVAVTNKKNKNGIDILCAYYVSTNVIKQEELHDLCAEYLPEYMLPSHYQKIKTIPLSPNGKIDKKQLPDPISVVKNKSDLKSPETLQEKWMHNLWCTLLNTMQIDIDANFFEMGGDSVMLVQLASYIEEEWGMRLALKDILEASTIRKCSKLLNNNSSENSILYISEHTPDTKNRYEPFPLTDIQMAYYLGRNSQFDLGDVTSHAYYEIEGEFNVARFQNALNKVIEHQDMMRIIFTDDGMQKILPSHEEYIVEVINVIGYDNFAKQKELMRIRSEMSHAKFDIRSWPLFDFKFIKLDSSKYRLCVGFDLLIADGTSMRILASELKKAYEYPALSLKAMDFSFRDYVNAIFSIQNTPKRTLDKEYWMDKIQEFHNAPDLISMQNKQPKNTTQSFERLSAKIDKEAWQAIKELIKNHKITPSTLLCTIYANILAQHCNQPKLTLNVTVFNRQPFHADVNNMVGDFTSLLPLNIDFSSHDNFWLHSQEIQNKLILVLDHNAFSGIEIIREIGKNKSILGSTVLPVVFTSLLFGEEDFGVLYSMGDIVYSISQTPQVYLDCQVMEVNNELLITWDYATDLLNKSIMEHLFGTFEQSIYAIADHSIEVGECLNVPYGVSPFMEKIINQGDIVLNFKNELCPVGVQGTRYHICDEQKQNNDNVFISLFGYCITENTFAYLNDNGEVINTQNAVNVNINTVRVDTKQIEQNLNSIQEVNQSFVCISQNKNVEGAYWLILYIAANNEVPSEIIFDMLGSLPQNVAIKDIIHVPEIPLDNHGEPDYKKLTDQYIEKNLSPVFENSIQEYIYGLWIENLTIIEFNLDDNFFALGGDSIIAIKLYSEIQKKYKMNMRDFFNFQTVRTLAAFLESCEECQSKKSEIENLKSKFSAYKSDDSSKLIEEQHKKYLSKIPDMSAVLTPIENQYTYMMLTGATGYLGSYVLKELIDNTKATIVLPIRGETDEYAQNRILYKLAFYFGKEYAITAKSRIIAVKADLTLDGLGIEPKHQELINKIECIINCAALMSHLANYSELYNSNVVSLENILELSNRNNHIPVVHISSSQIASSKGLHNECCIYTESDFFLNQKFEDNYSQSKYDAEMKIENWKNKYRNADIRVARVGNIVFDSTNGCFQENITNNAFYNLLNLMFKLQVIPEINEKVMEFTYVDIVAKALCAIALSPLYKNERFHITNPTKISMSEFYEHVLSLGIKIQMIPFTEFLEVLSQHFEDNETAVMLNELLLNLHLFTWFDPDKVPFLSDQSDSILKQLNVTWPEPTKNEIRNMLNYGLNVNYFEVKND